MTDFAFHAVKVSLVKLSNYCEKGRAVRMRGEGGGGCKKKKTTPQNHYVVTKEQH